MRRFRFLDHTGDLGVKVYGHSLENLFENAGQALFYVLTDPSKVREKVEREITLSYSDLEILMVDWLSELLYVHDVERLLFKRFEVRKMAEGGFRAGAWGEFFQEERHVIRTAVKAVTFHQLEVKQQQDRWHARVVFDL
jgi:SHS2 domain-containing protein